MAPISSIMGEIMQIAIPVDVAKISPMQVREYADWVLRPRLMAIPGVAQVIPIGGEVRQFQVQPDTARMSELGITHDQLEAALKGYSSNTSGGFLELNGREYLIRNLGRTSQLDDLQNVALTAKNGQPILLRQIANVMFAPAIKRGDAGFEGGPREAVGGADHRAGIAGSEKAEVFVVADGLERGGDGARGGGERDGGGEQLALHGGASVTGRGRWPGHRGMQVPCLCRVRHDISGLRARPEAGFRGVSGLPTGGRDGT
jgi:hypothetical protein